MATHIRSPPKNAFGKYVLNEEGNPVPEPDYLIWERWFENDEDCVLKQATLPGDVLVSTMFLGLDQNFRGHGPPILWETLIFGGLHDGYCERYASREAALAGHQTALKLARDAYH